LGAMKTMDEIKKILQSEKPYLAEKYGVTEIGVFGSYVRGDQRPDSDIDILIELERPPRISLLGLVDLEYYLSDLLGAKVDVAIKKNLRKRIGRRILSEVVSV
jgi:predicted nucleotidyltransferase